MVLIIFLNSSIFNSLQYVAKYNGKIKQSCKMFNKKKSQKAPEIEFNENNEI